MEEMKRHSPQRRFLVRSVIPLAAIIVGSYAVSMGPEAAVLGVIFVVTGILWLAEDAGQAP